MRKRLSRRWWNWSRTTLANNTFDTGSTTRPCGAQGRVSFMRGGGGRDKGRAAGEGQRPATGAGRLFDDGQNRQGHLRGQGQEAEKPGEPVFPGQRLPHRQDAEHGVSGGPLRHHLRHQRVRGPGAGELPYQAAHAPLQHPAEGRQGVPLRPPVQRGIPPLLPGEQDGQ